MTKITHDSEMLASGQQVITACAFIHDAFDGVEQVFLPKRADTKKFLPGVFELPGGHIEYGEDIRAGLVREVLEEFGMYIEVGDPFAAFTYTNGVKGSHAIEVVYFARFLDPIENIRVDPADHSAFAWIAEADIESIYTETKRGDDPEFQALRKGFALLRGEPPHLLTTGAPSHPHPQITRVRRGLAPKRALHRALQRPPAAQHSHSAMRPTPAPHKKPRPRDPTSRILGPHARHHPSNIRDLANEPHHTTTNSLPSLLPV